MNAKTFVLLAVFAVNANALPLDLVNNLLPGAAGGLPVPGLDGALSQLAGLQQLLGSLLPLNLLGNLVNLDCLTAAAIEQRCNIADVDLRCEERCNHTQICVNVCLNVPVVNGVLGLLTGQCVCKEGFSKDKQGLCVKLDACLDTDLHASGRKRRAVGDLLGNGVPVVGDVLPQLPQVLPLGLVQQLLATLLGTVSSVAGPLLGAGPVSGVAGPVTSLLNDPCAAKNATDCALLDLNLRCENKECTDAQVCANVCLNVPVLNGVVSKLTGECVCKPGFYRDQKSTLCLALDACLPTTGVLSG